MLTAALRRRCLDTEDRLCGCGARLSVDMCQPVPIITCAYCGRIYQTAPGYSHNDVVTVSTSLPIFQSLPLIDVQDEPGELLP